MMGLGGIGGGNVELDGPLALVLNFPVLSNNVNFPPNERLLLLLYDTLLLCRRGTNFLV